jgi:hypothetical protein
MPIKQQKRERSEYDERSIWRIQNKSEYMQWNWVKMWMQW